MALGRSASRKYVCEFEARGDTPPPLTASCFQPTAHCAVGDGPTKRATRDGYKKRRKEVRPRAGTWNTGFITNQPASLIYCSGALSSGPGLSESTSFRKSNAAFPNGGDFDGRRLRCASFLWETGGALQVGPSPERLRALVAGRDKAAIRPLRSKPDQDGTIWGAHPPWLVFGP